jgi:hypothetical protein
MVCDIVAAVSWMGRLLPQAYFLRRRVVTDVKGSGEPIPLLSFRGAIVAGEECGYQCREGANDSSYWA